MFSVEQLVANTAFDQLKSIDRSALEAFVHLTSDGPRPLSATSIKDYYFEKQVVWSTDAWAAVRALRPWSVQYWYSKPNRASAMMSFHQLIAHQVLRHRGLVLSDGSQPWPAPILEWFDTEKSALQASDSLLLPSFVDPNLQWSGVLLTWEGFALFCMWVTKTAFSAEPPSADTLRVVRPLLEALTSIWEMADSQQNALQAG